MSRKIVESVIALAVLILVLFWMQGGFHSRVPAGRTVLAQDHGAPARTARVQKAEVTDTITVSGTVVSKETARVASKIMGYVKDILVDAGNVVTKGQPLVRIDNREMVQQEAQERAALQTTRAELAQAKTDFDQFKSLLDEQSVTQRDFESVRVRYETAQASERRAKAALEEARTMQNFGVLRAPFDGIVAERYVQLGDMASPGQPLLSIFMPRNLEIVAGVSERYGASLKEGSPVSLSVPSLGLTQSSSIREVVPQGDEKSRTITVKAPLSHATGLRPGLYGTLSFSGAILETLAIPKEAVRNVGQLELVRVVEDGKVKTRHVKTGRVLQDKMEVLSGLCEGEEVVID